MIASWEKLGWVRNVRRPTAEQISRKLSRLPRPIDLPSWTARSCWATTWSCCRASPDGAFQLIYIDPPFNTGRAPAAARRCAPSPTPTATAPASAAAATAPASWRGRPTTTASTTTWRFLEPRLREARRLLDRERHALRPPRLPRGALREGAAGRAVRPRLLPERADLGLRLRRQATPPLAGQARHDPRLRARPRPLPLRLRRPSTASPTWRPGWSPPRSAARGKLPTTVWWHTIVPTTGAEKTGYPTQKPEGIVRRMVQASTRPGDRVLDFFAGSGTLGAVAEAARPPLRADRQQPGGGCGDASGGCGERVDDRAPRRRRRHVGRRRRCRGTGRARPRRGSAARPAASASGSLQSARRQSRMWLPSSVTHGGAVAMRSSGCQPGLGQQPPADRLARTGPPRPAAAPCSPSRATSFSRSATTTNRAAAHGHHLLAQVGAAQALDQRQPRGDLVGAVDRHVQPGRSSRLVQGDAQLAAAGGGALARWARRQTSASRPSASRSASASSISVAVEPVPRPRPCRFAPRRRRPPRPPSRLSAVGVAHGTSTRRGLGDRRPAGEALAQVERGQAVRPASLPSSSGERRPASAVAEGVDGGRGGSRPGRRRAARPVAGSAGRPRSPPRRGARQVQVERAQQLAEAVGRARSGRARPAAAPRPARSARRRRCSRGQP